MTPRFPALLIALTLVAPQVSTAGLTVGRHLLLGDFEEGWEEDWKHKRLYRPRTRYEAQELGAETVLSARSKRTASLYYRPLDVKEPQQAQIAWRWRVERSLTENEHEREKKGDDYAARLFVVFDPGLLGKNVRSLCYVWAGNQPVGSVYPSPYAENVRTVVLQSGDERAGRWIGERRDLISDFQSVFGEPPPGITAIAVMVDTDNTGTEVQAWYDDIVLRIGAGSEEIPRLE